jgi:hypothetical protein
MLKNSIPEIQRCNLTSVVLQLRALDIDTLTFNFMDMPPKEVSLFSYYFKFYGTHTMHIHTINTLTNICT